MREESRVVVIVEHGRKRTVFERAVQSTKEHEFEDALNKHKAGEAAGLDVVIREILR